MPEKRDVTALPISTGELRSFTETDRPMVTIDTAELVALLDAVDAAREVCQRLDRALKWNYENGRTQGVKELQFAIGATLSMRTPLERFGDLS